MNMTVAIYIRLSLEDDDIMGGKLESESVTNQRKMLTEYIRSSPELCGAEIVEFCDDGYSGKNFDRPGVTGLIEAAKSGRIQCILVKDLSRFGRDYIVVGNYITRVFPFLGVRFIAVNDHFDSSRQGDIDSLDTSFRTMIYDMYSRDLSRKVRSAKKQLAERGVYINSVAPYGYKKDADDRHLLLPDPETADTVRRIFTLSAEGVSTSEIAWILNMENIPTPSQAKVGTSSAHANWHPNHWRPQTVYTILRDRQYIGSTVFGKRVQDQIGVRRQIKVKLENWIVVDDRHEPLVSKELFQKAQEQLGGELRQTARYTKDDNPLGRKVYCGVCGYAIIQTRRKASYYRCGTPKTVPGMACSPEKVYAEEILDAVTAAIRLQARYAVEARDILEKQKKRREETLSALQRELQSLQSLQSMILEQNDALYERYADGLLTKDAYIRKKDALSRKLNEAYQREEKARQRVSCMSLEQNSFVEKYQGYSELDRLTDEIAADLLDRVTLWPDGRMEISLNYLDSIPDTIIS